MMRRIFFIFICMTFLFPAVSFAQDKPGKIEGDIRLEGVKPKKTAPAVVEYHGPCGTKRSTSVVHMWKRRVMGVTLWLTPTEAGEDSGATMKAYEMADPRNREVHNIVGEKCEFNPQMTIVRPGTVVKVSNVDPAVQWLVVEGGGVSKQQYMLNLGSEPFEIDINNTKEILLSSGFYPWMKAWIRSVEDVVAVAETDWDGRFFFNDIKPGKYILHSWHPSLGDNSIEIVVEEGKKLVTEVNYKMPPESPIPVIESPMLKEIFGGRGDDGENF